MDPDLDLNVMRQILKSRLREHFRACTAGCPKCEGWKKQVSDMKKRKRQSCEISEIIRDQTECCICLEAFVVKQEVTPLKCGHVFHPECILATARGWKKGKTVCPLCRQKHTTRLTSSARPPSTVVTRALLPGAKYPTDLAAVDIQCCWRRRTARKLFAARKKAAVTIQRCWKRRAARKELAARIKLEEQTAVTIQRCWRRRSARKKLTARKLKKLADTAQQRGFQVQSRNGNLIRLKLKESPFDVQAVRKLVSKQEQYRVLMRHITTNVQVNEGPRYFDYHLLINLQVKFYAYSIPNQQDRLLEEAYAYVTQMNLVA